MVEGRFGGSFRLRWLERYIDIARNLLRETSTEGRDLGRERGRATQVPEPCLDLRLTNRHSIQQNGFSRGPQPNIAVSENKRSKNSAFHDRNIFIVPGRLGDDRIHVDDIWSFAEYT